LKKEIVITTAGRQYVSRNVLLSKCFHAAVKIYKKVSDLYHGSRAVGYPQSQILNTDKCAVSKDVLDNNQFELALTCVKCNDENIIS
jgi:hypothetical protein